MTSGPAHSAAAPVQVRAWDVPTRLFHWALVLSIALAWASWRFSEAIDDPSLRAHRWIGHVVLVLLVFRILWGFAGASTARLSQLFNWPWTAARYFVSLLRGGSSHYLGHNPLGSYMILALFGAVAVQASMGLFTVEHNDLTAGPLYRLVSEEWQAWISSWHRKWFYFVLLALIPIHVLANIGYGVLKGDPVVRAMVTGKKPAASYVDANEARLAPHGGIRALLCLALAAAIVFGAIFAAGGKML